MDLLVSLTVAVAAAFLPLHCEAVHCPPLSFRTVDVECRWVMGRPVPCDVPATPGTRAAFSCKPLYRLPETVAHRLTQPDGAAMDQSLCREDGSWAPMPFTCVPECGRVVGNGETLVVGGKAVNSPVEFPWHVAVYDRLYRTGISQVCGGTLITTKFFVSAAHCFAAPSPGTSKDVRLRPAKEFAAVVGKLHRDWAVVDSEAQTRDVQQVHVNGYGGPRLNHVRDLALVEMASAVDLTAATLPACVDWGMEGRRLRDGDVGSVVGWGGLWKAPASSLLQSASLPFVSKQRCLQMIPSQLVQYVLLNDDRFCAGIINSTTVAHGDSGGGLTFQSPDRKWYLHGVVSVGMPDMRTLTAFTNVTSFVQWMADKIQDEEIRSAATEHQVPLEIPREYTASDLEEEQKVAYFREDVGLNLHHLHWHMHYSNLGPRQALAKGRRAELLFYMHAQLVARYNGERLNNGLPRVKRLELREPIKEGYYPKLDSLVSSRVWPGRPPHTRLQDLNRDGLKINIEDLELWSSRIYDAISAGVVQKASGGTVNFTEEGGAELLGNIVESSMLSPNLRYYGELMNQGHILISLAHDPDGRYLESFGVMGDAGTAIRDPVFYRWHAYIQDFMRKYKASLPSYTEQQLAFPDVSVRGVDVQSDGSPRPNVLFTHWQASDLELSRGFDFSPRPPIFARLTHLQHQPFSYILQVENKSKKRKEGFVRIFLAPKFDENGEPMAFDDQRHFMIEMDKFPATLAPGVNVVRRHSWQSTLTIPFERTFRNLDANRPAAGHALDEFTFCGCGLPQHMLLPRGSPQGAQYHLFVMVTDYTKDQVQQPAQGSQGACAKATSLCGVFGGNYPDRRPMGFPFDRPPAPRVTTLRSFLTPNMLVQSVVVRFKDSVLAAPRNTTVFGTKDNVNKLPSVQNVSGDGPKRQALRRMIQMSSPDAEDDED
ncbi:phenoloxidase 1-like [Thrips palmi]|uniref:Phenoloxidase 1-like n=1 Tax=Thrips palmi TaxID=161013 RepID=A0A6P9AGK8_THRPL|nr:phenoloxidase 1-like [Thrips palmi]